MREKINRRSGLIIPDWEGWQCFLDGVLRCAARLRSVMAECGWQGMSLYGRITAERKPALLVDGGTAACSSRVDSPSETELPMWRGYDKQNRMDGLIIARGCPVAAGPHCMEGMS
ncbi:hypothetical protein GCM10017056_28550 [Seohaeicola zhoushanensis]|uniref:Uncharacterized protein n=1 Tax=Seohaeicola zhoushanensis TaxID=1569283 RepID=A0A8J3M7X4_9RHOB|nr:hypothetical protein GCM10017056_28550 [Seohaeicola zhoushanensis]